MYKTRIHKWRIGRNIKQAELQAMLLILSERMRIGKTTEFCLRDRTISIADLKRYIEERNSTLDLELQQTRPLAKMPPDLRSYTPRPRSLQLHDTNEVYEKMMRDMEIYTVALVEKGLWTANGTRISGRNGDQAAIGMLIGYLNQVDRLWTQKDLEGFKWTLATATAQIKHIVHAQAPETFQHLIKIYIRKEAHTELIQSLLRQLFHFCKLMHGSSHPLGQICLLIPQMNPFHLKAALSRILYSYADVCQRLFGPIPPAILSLHAETSCELLRFGLRDASEIVRNLEGLEMEVIVDPATATIMSLDRSYPLSYALEKSGDLRRSISLLHTRIAELGKLDLGIRLY